MSYYLVRIGEGQNIQIKLSKGDFIAVGSHGLYQIISN